MSAWARAAVTAGAARNVAQKPGWFIALLVVGLCSLGSQSTSVAATLLGYIFALFFLINALSLLGVNPFSPLSVVKSLFQSPGWGRMLFALVLTGCALLAIWLFLQVSEVASWMVSWTNGDLDLTTALLVASLATVASSVVWLVRSWDLKELQKLPDENFDGGDKGSVVAFVHRARAYWKEVAGTLLLATVALVPAALLANWAWNVMASVLLPLFVLATRRYLSEQSVANPAVVQT